MDDCFFEPLDGGGTGAASRWRATVHTTGPWDARWQHGGPPSALLGRALESFERRDDTMVARVTVELLGPVPVGELELRVRMARPGRSVELVEAALAAGGRDVARASAWRILRTSGRAVPDRRPAPAPLPPPGPPLARGDWIGGYLDAVEWRPLERGFLEPGPGSAWSRLRHPLVAGEPTSPLQRVLAVADSGNGLSSEIDIAGWYFINPELTVHVHREAVGEWIALDAATVISPGGVGLATSVLSDRDGPLGAGAQSLLIARR